MHNTSIASFYVYLDPWKVETSPGVTFGLPVGNVISLSSYDSLTDVKAKQTKKLKWMNSYRLPSSTRYIPVDHIQPF